MSLSYKNGIEWFKNFECQQLFSITSIFVDIKIVFCAPKKIRSRWAFYRNAIILKNSSCSAIELGHQKQHLFIRDTFDIYQNKSFKPKISFKFTKKIILMFFAHLDDKQLLTETLNLSVFVSWVSSNMQNIIIINLFLTMRLIWVKIWQVIIMQMMVILDGQVMNLMAISVAKDDSMSQEKH